MFKILKWCTSGIFLWYWIITIFFNLPSNPIQIQFDQANRLFQDIFFQKWSFFAPPPKGNDKLYYFFRSKTDTNRVSIYETLDVLALEKQKAAPFNANEEIGDYIVSGSVSEITEFIYNYLQDLKVAHPNQEEAKLVSIALKDSWKMRAKILSIQTLFNYGKVVAKNNKLNLNDCEVKFVIANVDMVRFKDIDKNLKNIKPESHKLFETPYINLKN